MKRKVGCCGDIFTTHKNFYKCTLLKYAKLKPFIASHKIISKVFHKKKVKTLKKIIIQERDEHVKYISKQNNEKYEVVTLKCSK